MTIERSITVEGQLHIVVISDDKMALSAAKAAGRAIIGWWHPGKNQDLSPAQYLIGDLEQLENDFLERVVRRCKEMPWMIAETDRLIIREFVPEDISCMPKESGDQPGSRIFNTPDLLEAYIRNQYGFFGYGIWALVEKKTGQMIGKAGITDFEPEETANGKTEKQERGLELGYHIFEPYRRKGYAWEACHAIMEYEKRELDSPLYAMIHPNNAASAALIKKLGFTFVEQKYSEGIKGLCLYAWNY